MVIKFYIMKYPIKELALCLAACNECHDACLREQHVAMMAECIRLDKDCAAVCALALQVLHTGSRLVKNMLELCIEACDMCAIECSRHNDEHCQNCAKACRECAKACRAAM